MGGHKFRIILHGRASLAVSGVGLQEASGPQVF